MVFTIQYAYMYDNYVSKGFVDGQKSQNIRTEVIPANIDAFLTTYALLKI